MTNFGTLHVRDVILHQVPKGRRRADEADPIVYSEAPIDLPATERAFITERLRRSLSIGARPVTEAADNDLPSPDLIRAIFSTPDDLVGHSQELARQLYAKQAAISPQGLLMVLVGELRGETPEACLLIAKMEHETGMQVQPTTVAGKATYKAEFLRNLILGEGTKVFKVGIFLQSGARDGSKLLGEVVDDQQGGGGVADFFIEFLGCQFVQRPDVLTENFYKATQRFIRTVTQADPERGAEYEIALLSEMQNRSNRLTPTQFARNHMHDDDQDAFLAAMESGNVALNGFRKDVTLVASQIRRVKMQTGRGATVLVPPPMYEDGAVTVEQANGQEGDATITVRDKITSIGGASGGPKLTDDQPSS